MPEDQELPDQLLEDHEELTLEDDELELDAQRASALFIGQQYCWKHDVLVPHPVTHMSKGLEDVLPP